MKTIIFFAEKQNFFNSRSENSMTVFDFTLLLLDDLSAQKLKVTN